MGVREVDGALLHAHVAAMVAVRAREPPPTPPEPVVIVREVEVPAAHLPETVDASVPRSITSNNQVAPLPLARRAGSARRSKQGSLNSAKVRFQVLCIAPSLFCYPGRSSTDPT